ncbi:MAG: histidine phosphatase family protein [Candidatus Nomurabacteria bacterium]|nr:MAG: histidine phosphatase family protein [Candidatus Nomurabacteria bacterium]
MRHGEREGDQLTALGTRQVSASAEANLAGTRYLLAFHTGMTRTYQTAETILSTLEGAGSLTPRAEEGFGVVWALNQKWPIQTAQDQIKSLVASGAAETAALWTSSWPPALAILGRFLGTLEKWTTYAAMRAAEDGSPVGDGVRFLVASHSPCAELAALDPSATPRLGPADGITYEIEVDIRNLGIVITSSEVWRCPEGVE